jgi:branched-chain amino acid aminotransferase
MGIIPKVPWIWMDGKFVAWDDAQVHVTAHGLHYGTGVFEGIRCYETQDGPAVFRLRDHLARFFNSAALYELAIPYSAAALHDACLELVSRNRLGNAYIRPVAFFGAHSLDLWPRGCPVHVAMVGWPRGEYLGKESLERGVRIKVSPVRRFHSSVIPTTGKACGQYVNSVLAVQEALRAGFDEALMLNQEGRVAEGSGENLFIVKDGTVITNDADASILPGITRASVLEIARDLGLPVEVRPMEISEVTAADEAFFTGTAVEVTPIREIDGHTIGSGRRGPLTEKIQKVFFDAVHGRAARYRGWLSYAAAPASAADR